MFSLTWRKLIEPNGVWIGCICGSSVSNICWMRDSLLSKGLCHEIWSPLQNVFSVDKKTRQLIWKYNKIHSFKLHARLSVSLQRMFGLVPRATSERQAHFPAFHRLRVKIYWGKVAGIEGTQISKTMRERGLNPNVARKHKSTFSSEESFCLGGNMQKVQICCRRKVRGKIARNWHSFSSGPQPTHEQIDPSWRAERGWVVRRWEPGENGLLLLLHGF